MCGVIAHLVRDCPKKLLYDERRRKRKDNVRQQPNQSHHQDRDSKAQRKPPTPQEQPSPSPSTQAQSSPQVSSAHPNQGTKTVRKAEIAQNSAALNDGTTRQKTKAQSANQYQSMEHVLTGTKRKTQKFGAKTSKESSYESTASGTKSKGQEYNGARFAHTTSWSRKGNYGRQEIEQRRSSGQDSSPNSGASPTKAAANLKPKNRAGSKAQTLSPVNVPTSPRDLKLLRNLGKDVSLVSMVERFTTEAKQMESIDSEELHWVASVLSTAKFFTHNSGKPKRKKRKNKKWAKKPDAVAATENDKSY